MTEGPNTPPSPEGGAAGQQPPPPTPQQPQQPPAPQAPAAQNPAAQNPAPQAPRAPQDPQASTIGQPADLLTRFLAKLVDWILLGVVIGVIIVPLTIALAFSSAGSGLNPFGGFSVVGIVTSLVAYGLAIGYFAFLESNRGQTLGKILLKIQVQGPSGTNPTMEEALKRNAYILLPIIPVLGGLAYFAATIYIAVTINNDPTRTGFHDQFAGGTKVIKIG